MWEKHWLVSSRIRPNQRETRAHNTSPCPDQETNLQPFILRGNSQSTELHLNVMTGMLFLKLSNNWVSTCWILHFTSTSGKPKANFTLSCMPYFGLACLVLLVLPFRHFPFISFFSLFLFFSFLWRRAYFIFLATFQT